MPKPGSILGFAISICWWYLFGCANAQRVITENYVFVGTFEQFGSIVRYTIVNGTNGTITQSAEYITAGSPTFLATDVETESMYVLHNFGPNTWGRLSYYGISHYGDLYLGGFSSTLGSMPNQADIFRSTDRKKAICVANDGGALSLYQIMPDGSVSTAVQSFTRAGNGACAGTRWGPECVRFRVSHPMMCLFSRGNTTMANASVYVADQGLNALIRYDHQDYNTTSIEKLAWARTWNFQPSAAPQAVALSNDGRFAFVSLNASATIAVFNLTGDGAIQLQTVSLTARLRLPSGTRCQGGSLLAHPNGVLLLATVNNCTLVQTDRLITYRIQPNGTLTFVTSTDARGRDPSSLVLNRQRNRLWVANTMSKNLVNFKYSTNGFYTFLSSTVTPYAPTSIALWTARFFAIPTPISRSLVFERLNWNSFGIGAAVDIGRDFRSFFQGCRNVVLGGTVCGWSSGARNMLTVQADPAGGTDRVMRVLYQANLYGDNGGAQFYTRLSNLSNGAMLEYDVLFPGNFDFRLGGKLPGMHGGNLMCSGSKMLPNGTNCFSTRLMWRENGAGEVYFYLPLARQEDAFCRECTQPSGFSCASMRDEPHCSWRRGAFSLPRGRWNKIQQFVRMNTPGQANGIMQLFINGVLVMQSTEVLFRTTTNLNLDGMFFSTFFGGDSPAFGPTTNQFSFFKNFKVYRYNY